MATVAIFDFQKFELLTACPLSSANVRHRAKFIKIGQTVA